MNDIHVILTFASVSMTMTVKENELDCDSYCICGTSSAGTRNHILVTQTFGLHKIWMMIYTKQTSSESLSLLCHAVPQRYSHIDIERSVHMSVSASDWLT